VRKSQQSESSSFCSSTKEEDKKSAAPPLVRTQLRRKISSRGCRKKHTRVFHLSDDFERTRCVLLEQSQFFFTLTHTHTLTLYLKSSFFCCLFVRLFVCTATTKTTFRRELLSSSLARSIHHQRWWFMYT